MAAKSKHYVIETVEARGGFLKDLLALPLSKPEPLRISVEWGGQPEKRSLDQNAYFHHLCGMIADETGNSRDAVKQYLVGQFIPMKAVKIKNHTRLIVPGTSSLSKEEFSVLIDKVLAWSQTEMGIVLPTAEQVSRGAT